MPLPEIYKETETFYSLLNNEIQHNSLCNDYENGCYKFSSYAIFLDMHINHINRKYDTIMSLVSEIGAIKTGAMLLLSFFISRHTSYVRDKELANSVLYERKVLKNID